MHYRRPVRVIHLSDTHLQAVDGPNSWGFNASDSLRTMLHDLRHVTSVDVIVVSGDIADDGSREAYVRARELVGGFAEQHGCPVLWTTGNHDERTAFSIELGHGHLGTQASQVITTYPQDIAASTTIDGHRFVTLDSLVPSKGYGLLSSAQLQWLRELLTEPAPYGTTLALHHSPVTLEVEVQKALGLQEASCLAEVIEGTDVRLILCGHFHQQVTGFLGAALVWVTPGVVNRIDHDTGAPGTERAVRGASATVIDLGGPSSPVLHTVQARDAHIGELAYELDADQLADVIDRVGPAVRQGR